jgi:alanine racemase
MRALHAVLSTENLLHNLAALKQSSPRSKILAMVKANAYGHGLRSVSQRIEKHVDALGVASIDEALALRGAGITKPVALMEGVFAPDELLIASRERFHVVFHDLSQVRWLKESALPAPLVAWIKVDTGMGRLGFSPDAVPELLSELASSPSIAQPPGIMSHFACADEPDHSLNAKQMAAFNSLAGLAPGPKSLCNSAALLSFPDHHYEWVRPGLSLYGASPVAGRSAESLGLKPVMTLRTEVIAVHAMKKGMTLGYGAAFECPEDMMVGIIAVGYGDGYPRSNREGVPVLVNGARCKIVGRVSMDMITVDLRTCPDAMAGDPVTLWGEGLPVEEVATATDRIAYDLLTGVQLRVPFRWS